MPGEYYMGWKENHTIIAKKYINGTGENIEEAGNISFNKFWLLRNELCD